MEHLSVIDFEIELLKAYVNDFGNEGKVCEE
jgi:hypothetical protein